MVFRISKIHTNADFTFSNNKVIEDRSICIDGDIGNVVELLK